MNATPSSTITHLGAPVTAEALARARAELRAGRRNDAVAAARSRDSAHRLRRVLIDCHGWVRDSVAVVGDHVWCATCADWTRVVDLVE